jgi:hypothetical protein
VAVNAGAQIQVKTAENLNQTRQNSRLFTVTGAFSTHATDNVEKNQTGRKHANKEGAAPTILGTTSNEYNNT